MYKIFDELLQRSNVTPYKVSKATGIATATLSDWKNGRSEPKPDKLQKIADYFGVTVDYLLTGSTSNTLSSYDKELVAITKTITNDKNLRNLFQLCEQATESDIKVITDVLTALMHARSGVDQSQKAIVS